MLSAFVCSPSRARSTIRHGREGWRGEKSSLVQPVTAVHQDWCGTNFLFQQTCWENEGGGLKGGRNSFILHDEIVSHRKHQGPTSSHSCIMISENLVCKLWKKPSSDVLNSLNLQENRWQVTTWKLWTVSVEGSDMKWNLFFSPKLFKENMKCKNMGVGPGGIGLFCFTVCFFLTVQREWAIWLLNNARTFITLGKWHEQSISNLQACSAFTEIC